MDDNSDNDDSMPMLQAIEDDDEADEDDEDEVEDAVEEKDPLDALDDDEREQLMHDTAVVCTTLNKVHL